MTLLVDPEIQRLYDRTAAEYGARGAAVTAELRARQREIAERAERAAAQAAEARASARRQEENDLSARAVDYQEPDEDEPPPPPRRAPAAPRAEDDDEVPSFQWDEV